MFSFFVILIPLRRGSSIHTYFVTVMDVVAAEWVIILRHGYEAQVLQLETPIRAEESFVIVSGIPSLFLSERELSWSPRK